MVMIIGSTLVLLVLVQQTMVQPIFSCLNAWTTFYRPPAEALVFYSSGHTVGVI